MTDANFSELDCVCKNVDSFTGTATDCVCKTWDSDELRIKELQINIVKRDSYDHESEYY